MREREAIPFLPSCSFLCTLSRNSFAAGWLVPEICQYPARNKNKRDICSCVEAPLYQRRSRSPVKRWRWMERGVNRIGCVSTGRVAATRYSLCLQSCQRGEKFGVKLQAELIKWAVIENPFSRWENGIQWRGEACAEGWQFRSRRGRTSESRKEKVSCRRQVCCAKSFLTAGCPCFFSPFRVSSLCFIFVPASGKESRSGALFIFGDLACVLFSMRHARHFGHITYPPSFSLSRSLRKKKKKLFRELYQTKVEQR